MSVNLSSLFDGRSPVVASYRWVVNSKTCSRSLTATYNIKGRCGLSKATRIPNFVKVSQIAAELWRFSFFSKWRQLDWRCGTLRTACVYRRAKFGNSISNSAWVMEIFGFSKWRPAAILDFVFRPHTKSTWWPKAMFKILCQSNLYFRRYCDFNFQKFGLKCLFGTQKWGFGGFRPLNILGYHQDPEKALRCILTYRSS